MSSNDGGSDDAGGQGGQPTGGQGQPQGGQPQGGQPQGGQPRQPQGGQPAGQPAGGQPQGGYQQGPQAGYGEGIGDIFSKPTTLNSIKSTLIFYTLVGIGAGLAGFIFANQYLGSVSGSGSGAAIAQAMTIMAIFAPAFLLGPVLAIPVGLRTVDNLSGIERDELIYATAGVGTLVGNVILVALFRVLISIEIDGDIDFGELLISGIGGGVGAAIVAIGAAYWVLNQTRR